MKRIIQKVAAVAAVAAVGLFAGGWLGVVWAQMLCGLVGGTCPDGAAVIGGAIGLCAMFVAATCVSMAIVELD